ncbi:hypothetical protein ACJA29_01595 [Metamycoplasma sualvi]|uniref:hypothetical protein n=1 Tax=Metamycoplasma sualvi TaxID=2125 RepID=UPI0038730666
MIKQVIFKKTNSFNAKPIVLNFDKNINVIIGPKGGGKSTLFDLLAGLKNNYIADSVIKALEGYNLKFEKAIKFSNEEILFSQLSKKKNKEKISDYEERNDVIYQDDIIKKDLTSAKDIEDQKFQYIKKQVYQSESVVDFILKLKNLYNSMNFLNSMAKNNDINWSNTFRMNELKADQDKLMLLTKLDYKNNQIKSMIDEEVNEYKSFIKSTEEFKSKLKRIEKLDKNLIIENEQFNKEINTLTTNTYGDIDKLKEKLLDRKKQLENIAKATDIFAFSYKKVIDNIKNENYSTSGLKSYEIAAKNHFKNFAKNIFNLIKDFEKLISEDIYLDIKNDENQKTPLRFKIDKDIKLSDESKTEILKIIFHSPGSSRDDVDKWLKSLSKNGIKEFNEEKIKNCIAREIKENTQIMVDFGKEEKDYNCLSLGQKSIYGLKYKFNRSLNQDLFLDQPEDNLDNNTIATEVLDLIKEKKDQQVFIVTHNANIGILTNPSQIIVANLNNEEEPYKISNILEIINEESANYLEGGKEYLEKRYNKIINN